MFVENRSEHRVPIALRLDIGAGADAVTRDVSPSGLYFELPGRHEFAGTLLFEMKLERANMKFTAEGTVLRVEHRDGVTGVALRLLDGRLQPIA